MNKKAKHTIKSINMSKILTFNYNLDVETRAEIKITAQQRYYNLAEHYTVKISWQIFKVGHKEMGG